MSNSIAQTFDYTYIYKSYLTKTTINQQKFVICLSVEKIVNVCMCGDNAAFEFVRIYTIEYGQLA